MRGRKPKPTNLKILEGCRRDRINPGEPAIAPGSVEAPGWLEGLARDHWDELAPILAGARVLSIADRAGLAVLCDDYRRLRSDPDDWKARDRYRRMLIEFGLTPSSRSRLKVPAEGPADELEEFLVGAKKAQ
jgi:phage terminase small subunit